MKVAAIQMVSAATVRANLEAWHSDLKADDGEGFAIYPDHNLHMLLYAASMDGQGGIATQAGKQSEEVEFSLLLGHSMDVFRTDTPFSFDLGAIPGLGLSVQGQVQDSPIKD